MEFDNPGYFLKPGMFASVQIISELEPSALLVPDSAVLRSGEKNTVFVALDGGKFDPRTVVLGLRGGKRHVSSPQRLERGRTHCHLRPVHARFGKPVARGDPENARAERASATESASAANTNATEQASSTNAETEGCGLCLPDAGARLHHLRSSGQMSDLRHDARAGDAAANSKNFSPAARCFTTPARCRSTATFTKTNRASVPSAA